MKSAIIFGGSGFIGSHIADELTARGYKTTIYDLRESPFLKEGQKMIVGDLMDEKKVSEAVAGCDFVYNFAGVSNLDSATTMPIDTIKQNILGNANVMNACVQHKVKRFVYASTVYVYSAYGGFYRCSKQASEIYMEEYQHKYGLEFTILRYGSVYGPRSDDKNGIYRYIKEAMQDGKIRCEGSGDEIREYIHVRDLAKLSVDILESAEFANQYVNITGQHPTRFRDLLATIKEMLHNKVEIEMRAPKTGHPHYNMTPYSFAPRIGRKLVSNHYIDLGQGLLELMEDMHREMRKDGK